MARYILFQGCLCWKCR